MAAYYLGIDVSKGYADFTVIDENHNTVEPAFQLDDTFEGHRQLYQVLTRLLEAAPNAKLFAAVESTGGYENNWVAALWRFQRSLPVEVARLNPARVSDHAKAKYGQLEF